MVDLAQAAMWHRQVAALAMAADRVGVAEEELPLVRARLLTQRSRLTEAADPGRPLPSLEPTPTEVSAAAPALGDLSTAAVTEALRTMSSTLDAADSVLAAHLAATMPVPVTAPAPALAAPPTPVEPVAQGAQVGAVGAPPSLAPPRESGVSGWSAGPRNALVYGGYAFTVLLVQLVLLALADEETTLPLLAPVCLIVLPAFAWAAGWFTIGLAFRPPPGARGVKRTPRLGAIVCLVPNFVLCAGLGILFLAR